MQEISTSLAKQPQSTKPAFDTRLNTWFILDQIRGKKTLPTFYQGSNSGLIASIEYLLMGTEHAHLLEASPLLIKLNHTQLSEMLYNKIQQERSGIFVQSKNDHILPHLQYLFTMQSETEGKIYARYYDPIFWTALQLSLIEQQKTIWGNIEKVFTITPDSREDKLNYFTWTNPNLDRENQNQSYLDKPIQLTPEFYELSEDVRLLYFINEAAYFESLTIPEEQLSKALLNLKILIKSGIQRGDHLQKLLKNCITYTDFSVRPEVQQILRADIATFEKAKQLVALV